MGESFGSVTSPTRILYLNSRHGSPLRLYQREYPQRARGVRSGGNDIMRGGSAILKRRTKNRYCQARDHLVTMANTYADYFICEQRLLLQRTAALGIAPSEACQNHGWQ